MKGNVLIVFLMLILIVVVAFIFIPQARDFVMWFVNKGKDLAGNFI